MKQKLREEIPEKKLEEVKGLSELLKSKKTVLIVSIKNLPASQFQEISKKLRGKAIIKVPKKSLIVRAIDDSKDDKLSEIKEYITDSTAILFSDLDSFDLAGDLIDNKRPAKAKIGQEAPEDIIIPEGPTELMSGPAISDFGVLGIPIKIDKGKIAVKESTLIVKKGDKISEAAAGMMSKLDIKPFSIGFIPLSAFDTVEKKLFSEIKIDKEGTINELKTIYGKALAFAVDIGHFSKDTIGYIMAKAAMHAKALEGLVGKSDEKVEEVKEEVKEESNDQSQEQKTEEEK